MGVHCRTSIQWPEGSVVHNLFIHGLDSSTILFVFISGFLFQYINAEKFEYTSYLSKKIKYVMIPYVLVSIPALLDKLFLETNAYWMNDFYKSLYAPLKIVFMLVTGKHSGPFYFIPMISIIFFITPFLYKIQKSNYFSVITLIVVGSGLFTYAYGYYGSIGESLLYFLPVYIFGMWVSKNREQILFMSNYFFIGLLCSYLIIFYLEMTNAIFVEHLSFFQPTHHYFTAHFNWSKLKEMMLAIILLTVFFKLRNRDLSHLALLGSYSFGIYFVHIYFTNLTEYLIRYFKISSVQNGLGFLMFTAITVGISTITVYAVKKIFRDRSRLLIGS